MKTKKAQQSFGMPKSMPIRVLYFVVDAVLIIIAIAGVLFILLDWNGGGLMG
ncbi:MAG: hypothetical protein PHW66_05675 [Gallionella sp.]|nr:hypothetical protein [Gallionella sp.]